MENYFFLNPSLINYSFQLSTFDNISAIENAGSQECQSELEVFISFD